MDVGDFLSYHSNLSNRDDAKEKPHKRRKEAPSNLGEKQNFPCGVTESCCKQGALKKDDLGDLILKALRVL